MADTCGSSTEKAKEIGNKVGCFNRFYEFLNGERNSKNCDLKKTNVGFLRKENNKTIHIETELFNNGRRYNIPEGLEIIPIYNKSISDSNSTQTTNTFESVLSSSDFCMIAPAAGSNRVIANSFSFEKTLHLNTVAIKNRDFCKVPSEKMITPSIEIEEKQGFICSSKPKIHQSKETLEGIVNSNISLNQHVLLAAIGLFSNKEISQTNLELFIEQKPSGEFYCKLCGMEAESSEIVGNHINSKHSSRKDLQLSIKCPFCPYMNTNKFKLISHISSHSMLKPFQCPTCGYETTKRDMLKRHISSHLEDKMYNFSECSYMSNERYKVKVDNFNQHSIGMKLFHCEVCGFSAADESTLTRHLMKHSDTKIYKCDSCLYTGKSLHDLQKHEKSHTNVKPFSCPMCSFKCNLNSNMRKHIKTHTNEKFKCADCNFVATSKLKHFKHTLKHTGKLRYQCNKCSYETTYSCDFKSHMNKHNNIRDFKCQFCDYAGTSNINLKRHMLVHSLEKPFKCCKCDYASKEKSKLKRHMNVHKEMLPNKCPTCDFENYHNSNFRRHLLTHKDCPKFICDNCGLVCYSRAKIIQHLKTHVNHCDSSTGNKN